MTHLKRAFVLGPCFALISGCISFGCSADPESDTTFGNTQNVSSVGSTTTGTTGGVTATPSTTGGTTTAPSTTGAVAVTGTGAGTLTGTATTGIGTSTSTVTGVTSSTATSSTSAGGASSTGDTSTTTSTSTTSAVTSTSTSTTGSVVGLDNFSFFVTSLAAMRELSGSQDGFGGDLRFGEADGLTGADKICATIAESSMAGSSAKQWRAFLSAEAGPDGGPVNAIDRIGTGPWYDRLGRLVAEDLDGLLNERPAGSSEIADDLPNELGEPNHTAGGQEMDNHDTLTGSDENGMLAGSTCSSWTSISGDGPEAGHSWPANSGQHWISSHGVAGCAPSVVSGNGQGGGGGGEGGVGDGGGYGGIYCFALSP